jgi:hypothetical protein
MSRVGLPSRYAGGMSSGLCSTRYGSPFNRRLILDHRSDHNFARSFSVDSVLGNQITAFFDDDVGVLHHFQLSTNG